MEGTSQHFLSIGFARLLLTVSQARSLVETDSGLKVSPSAELKEAVSRDMRKGASKVVNRRRKSFCVPSLIRSFPMARGMSALYWERKTLRIIVPNQRTASLESFPSLALCFQPRSRPSV